MKLSRFFTALGVSLCALGSIHTASAALLAGDTLYIDFGRNDVNNGVIMPSNSTMNTGAGNSTGIADSYGLYWNNAWMNFSGGGGTTPPALTNLINSTNVGTGLGLSFSGGWQSNGFNNGGLMSPSSSLLGNFASTNATGDYYFFNAQDTTGPVSLTLTGLDPSLTYDFKIFATRQQTTGTDTRTSRYSITDINGLHTYDLQTTGADIGAGGYDGNNNTFATLNGIIPNGSGAITISVTNAASTFAYIGAMQVTAVQVIPEPSTVALVGAAGLAGLVIYRRRRA